MELDTGIYIGLGTLAGSLISIIGSYYINKLNRENELERIKIEYEKQKQIEDSKKIVDKLEAILENTHYLTNECFFITGVLLNACKSNDDESKKRITNFVQGNDEHFKIIKSISIKKGGNPRLKEIDKMKSLAHIYASELDDYISEFDLALFHVLEIISKIVQEITENKDLDLEQYIKTIETIRENLHNKHEKLIAKIKQKSDEIIKNSVSGSLT